MKKSFLILAFFLFFLSSNFAQKKNPIEVLYFKANLACCKAKACNALENDIKSIIEKNFPDNTVVMKEIKLSDTSNQALISKYNAKSQTVVIVRKKKKKEFSIDISDIVKTYINNQDKVSLEKAILSKIDEINKL